LIVLQVNTEAFVLYKLGKLTAEWLVAQGKAQLVPAFNGFQVGAAVCRSVTDLFLQQMPIVACAGQGAAGASLRTDSRWVVHRTATENNKSASS
jgi:hypothetical protein